jgi:hypothetical protein
MFIIGLQGCGDCHEYFKLHPEHKYIELRKDKNQKSRKTIGVKPSSYLLQTPYTKQCSRKA